MADDGFPHLSSARDDAELLLLEVAEKIQLTPTQHLEAETNYRSLANWVNAPDSALASMVLNVYPSGSFAIGAPILGKVKSQQHDLDAVIELNIRPDADPKWVLETLERAIKKNEGSRYHELTRRNSRCVTVTYVDGRSVDLMPVARLPGTPDRVAHLFHWNERTGESYHKEVNPKGFAEHFLNRVTTSASFAETNIRRLKAKAETVPLPAQIPLEKKAPRIVALQLIKRMRDIAYRRPLFKDQKKPPSVVMAALALEAGPASDFLSAEIIKVATSISRAIRHASASGQMLRVLNPSWSGDVFTDRWPQTIRLQDLFATELENLAFDIDRLANEYMSAIERADILKRNFGETAARHAVGRLGEAYSSQRSRGRTTVGTGGAVSILPTSAAALPKRTNFGGEPQ